MSEKPYCVIHSTDIDVEADKWAENFPDMTDTTKKQEPSPTIDDVFERIRWNVSDM